MAIAGVKKRRNIANYLNTASDETAVYNLMGVGFTELNEQPSAQTTSKRYINMASASQSVTGYEPTWAFTADQIRSETALNFICEIGELRKTGADAETDMVIVDLDKPVEEQENTFFARRQKVAVAVSAFGDEDGEMTCEGDLLGIGDVEIGSFNTQTKTFTDAAAAAQASAAPAQGTD